MKLFRKTSRERPLLKIKVRLLSYREDKEFFFEGWVEIRDGLRLGEFFKQGDRLTLCRENPGLRRLLKQKPPPAILVNGDPLPLPEGLAYRLADGDEITVLTPLAGG